MNIRLMSHNVWGMYAPDVVKEVANRAELMARVYTACIPDVIGMQEFSQDIRAHGLPGLLAPTWRELDVSADTAAYGMKNLYTPLYYRPGILSPLRAGFVLFDRSFNNSDSKGVTWAVFCREADGAVFSVCNTHYWWKSGPEHDAARVENSRVILGLLRELPAPFFVMGDLNCRAGSAACRTLLEGGLCDAQASAAQSMDSNTHHAYPDYDPVRREFFGAPQPTGGYRLAIDHLFADAAHAGALRRFGVVTTPDACNTSDHCPIWLDADI